MCSISLDPCDIWKERIRTARVPHRCSGCGAEIHPGEPYLDHNSLFEGEWSHEAACAPCALTRNAFADEHGQSFTPSFLEEMLRECIDPGNRQDPWRPLLAGLKRRWRVSAGGRKHLSARWTYDRERRARHAAWRALRSLESAEAGKGAR